MLRKCIILGLFIIFMIFNINAQTNYVKQQPISNLFITFIIPLLSLGIFFTIIYFVCKAAVKKGIVEAFEKMNITKDEFNKDK